VGPQPSGGQLAAFIAVLIEAISITPLAYQLTKEILVNEVMTVDGLVVDREVVVRYVLSSDRYEVVELPGLCNRCLLTPNSTLVVEEVRASPIPLPIIVIPALDITRGSLFGNSINGTNGTIVEVKIRVLNLLSIPVVVAISAQYPDNVRVITDRRELYSNRVGSQTLAYWSYVVEKDAVIPIRFSIESLGSWHVLRLPPISIMYTVNFDELEDSYRSRINETKRLAGEASAFTSAVGSFRRTIEYFRKNMTEFSRLLNSSADRLRTSAIAVNTSLMVVESINRQLNALANSFELLALTVNTSKLLIDYEYVFLKTMATALRAQSNALYTYADMVEATIRNLELLDRTLAELEGALVNLRGEQLPSNISSVIDSLIARTRSTRMSISYVIDELSRTSRDIRGVAVMLERVSKSTEDNATLIISEAPAILTRISENMTLASRYLLNATESVGRSSGFIQEAVGTLVESSRWLSNASAKVLSLTYYLRAQECNLTLIESYLRGQAERLNATALQLEDDLRRLTSFREVVNANSIRVSLAIRLPSVVDYSALNKLRFGINGTETWREDSTRPTEEAYRVYLFNTILLLATVLTIALLSTHYLVKRRREIRSSE